MSYINNFTKNPDAHTLPKVFPSPFKNTPHPLAIQAAELLQTRLAHQSDWQHDFSVAGGGKMLGVLVVKDNNNRVGYLAGFSGMLAGSWVLPGFVPPIFDQTEVEQFLPAGEALLADYTNKITALETSQQRLALQTELQQLLVSGDAALSTLKEKHKIKKSRRRSLRDNLNINTPDKNETQLVKLSLESQQDKRDLKALNCKWSEILASVQSKIDDIDAKINSLKKDRSRLSNKLHNKVFATYKLSNKLGEQINMADFFEGKLPPGGSGDCAGAKLIHYAHQHGLTALALAEFWWGASPKEAVRHHGHYYPACRGKCQPILPFMLKGYELEPSPVLGIFSDLSAPAIVYEDSDVLVVNKPHGLLSIPGKAIQDSVLTRIQQRYPEATGPLLVHRLDLPTSGLLLIAKNSETHKALQKQFLERSIEKRYVALLSSRLSDTHSSGTIELPLRVDIDDRPRQRVCYAHGKAARTEWEIINREADTTRVYFYPKTGRTHQLRIHASHKEGLNAPIKGDSLYGDNEGRLRLHAERLCFTRPGTGKRIEVVAPAPF